jgi:hypothetical protein
MTIGSGDFRAVEWRASLRHSGEYGYDVAGIASVVLRVDRIDREDHRPRQLHTPLTFAFRAQPPSPRVEP